MDDDAEVEYAKAAYLGSCALQKAGSATRAAIASCGGKGDQHADVCVATYLRSCYWMDSIVRLKEPADAQAVFHGVRCIYQLWFDLVDLTADPTLVPRLLAFHFVSRFAAAEKLVNALDAHSMPGVPGDNVERQFILDADNRKQFDSLRATYWGTNSKGKPVTPTHWHSLSLADRAKAHGKDEEVRYRRLYSKLCWYSHAGLVNLAPSALVTSFCMGHVFAQSIFLAATHVVAEHLNVFAADPKAKESLDEFSRAEAAKLDALARKYRHTEEQQPATEKG